jgi:hypothetical protein
LSYNKFMHEQIHFTTCSHTWEMMNKQRRTKIHNLYQQLRIEHWEFITVQIIRK